MNAEISNFVQTACIWEACARKVGNVHRIRDFASTSLTDFLLSSSAIGPSFSVSQSLGKTVLQAINATNTMVGQNTNLGIILAIAPLALCRSDRPIREEITRVLSELTVEDTRDVYRAIRIASPSGLGKVDNQDVSYEPTATLLESMKLAADRDQIARLYATEYRDLFDFGLPVFANSFRSSGRIEPAIIDLQFQWLARDPDSLIVRKNDLMVAEEVRQHAANALALGGIRTIEGRRAGRILDAFLRSNGNRLNPGTTADLIVAVLFVALRERIVTPRGPFPWQVEDWL